MSDKNIEVLQTHLDHWKRLLAEGICDKTEGEDTIEAFQAAIEALKEPCEQIKWERDTALAQLKELGYGLGEKIRTDEDAVSRDTILQEMEKRHKEGDTITLGYIKNLPPVTPKPRTGHWVEIGDEPYDTWECDNCGFVIDGSGCVDPEEYRDIYKYCPNCGAKMEGESK